jgi:hypothetical protein
VPKDLIESTDASPAGLDDLALRINAEHEAAFKSARAALEHAINCGRLLLEAKAKAPRGTWLPWLREHTAVSERTAQRWMRFAENAEALLAKSATVADLAFPKASRLLAAPKPASCELREAGGVEDLPNKLVAAVDEFVADAGKFLDLDEGRQTLKQRLAVRVDEQVKAPVIEVANISHVVDVVAEPVLADCTADTGLAKYRDLQQYFESAPALPSLMDIKAMTTKQRRILRRLAERSRATNVALLDRLDEADRGDD